jgi:hypothetical protein
MNFISNLKHTMMADSQAPDMTSPNVTAPSLYTSSMPLTVVNLNKGGRCILLEFCSRMFFDNLSRAACAATTFKVLQAAVEVVTVCKPQ